jgi:hypothetical protein
MTTIPENAHVNCDDRDRLPITTVAAASMANGAIPNRWSEIGPPGDL